MTSLRKVVASRWYIEPGFNLGAAAVQLLLECGHTTIRKAARYPKRAYCKTCKDAKYVERSAQRRRARIMLEWKGPGSCGHMF
jgi:hypothetical protein